MRMKFTLGPCLSLGGKIGGTPSSSCGGGSGSSNRLSPINLLGAFTRAKFIVIINGRTSNWFYTDFIIL